MNGKAKDTDLREVVHYLPCVLKSKPRLFFQPSGGIDPDRYRLAIVLAASKIFNIL